MREIRRRPIHYSVSCLHDGTVLAAYPIRKPSARILKRDGRRIDDDKVCVEFPGSGMELSDVRNETRTRFQDILANALNTRRAIRALLSPELNSLADEIAQVRSQLAQIVERVATSAN